MWMQMFFLNFCIINGVYSHSMSFLAVACARYKQTDINTELWPCKIIYCSLFANLHFFIIAHGSSETTVKRYSSFNNTHKSYWNAKNTANTKRITRTHEYRNCIKNHYLFVTTLFNYKLLSHERWDSIIFLDPIQVDLNLFFLRQRWERYNANYEIKCKKLFKNRRIQQRYSKFVWVSVSWICWKIVWPDIVYFYA